jgi:DNA repair protein RecO (recombination protein O)
MAPSTSRVQLAESYVLHSRAYRETGRIVELFAREHGRLTAFARGARGPRSKLAPLLRPFQRMLVSWSGRGEAVQLTGIETAVDPDALPGLPPSALLSGWYVNELLMRLTTRHDHAPELFDDYARSLQGLAGGEPGASAALRRFEKRLLEHAGYGLDFALEAASGDPVSPLGFYRLRLGDGFVRCAEPATGDGWGEIEPIPGSALLAIAEEQFTDAAVSLHARRALRSALDHLLDGRSLATREVARAIARAVPRSRA